MSVPVIDVHTHMLSPEFLAILREHGGPKYAVEEIPTMVGPRPAIHRNGAMFMNVMVEMLDYDLRIRDMDKVGVDIAIVSLTCPNVYWGGKTSA